MFKKQIFALAVCGMASTFLWGAEARRNEPFDNRAGTVAADDRAIEQTGEGTNAVPFWRDVNRWSFQAGVGWITASTIDEVALLEGDWAEGDAGGQIYLLQVSYKLAEWEPVVFEHRGKMDLEAPFVLGVVDERRADPFMQYSGGLTLRWKQFPWNKWLYTNIETGIGLTYSQRVLAAERERHPGRERSHLEFYWPVRLMLAHPRWREHQLVFFLHHHSGGLAFHEGGANTLGLGYRYVPGERR